MNVASIPQWLAAALLAAALSMVGFVGKQILEWVAGMRAARRERRARLVTLFSLLGGTAAIFRTQSVLRDRLHEMVIHRNPELARIDAGYDAVFSAAFSTMSAGERELHAVIRGYTVSGLKPLNQAMSEWLRADTQFKLGRSWRKRSRKLSRQLIALEAHLLMWLAKYAVWIPDTASHALVYLNG